MMKLILLTIGITSATQLGLWWAIKRFRFVTSAASSVSAATTLREAMLWLLSTIVVLLLLGLLLFHVYRREGVKPETAGREAGKISIRTCA